MSSSKKVKRALVFVALFLSALMGCSGNDGAPMINAMSPGSEDGEMNDGVMIPGSGPPFSGRMVGGRQFADTLLAIDLPTGRHLRLPGAPQLAEQGFLRREATVETQRDRSVMSGLLITIDDCLVDMDGLICFFFLDRYW